MQKLTSKQDKFAQAIALENMSQADAYRFAYNASNMADETIWAKASALAKKDNVPARIDELRKATLTPKIMSARERKEWLTKVIQNSKETTKNRLSASDQLNRMEGLYVQKVQAEVASNVTVNVELVDDE